MKVRYFVLSVFHWIAFLHMKITNCATMTNSSSSASQEIDEDRAKAAAELPYLCDWSPFIMRGPVKDVASECSEKCGKRLAFLHPDRKSLICFTTEENAGVYSYSIFQSTCECGLVVQGGKREGKRRKRTSCENIPYRIKVKRRDRWSCQDSCENVKLFVTKNRPNAGLSWCDVGELNSIINKVQLKGIVKGRFKEIEKRRRRKCWCGLTAGDIQPSILPTPIVGMEYWLLEGLKHSREIRKANLPEPTQKSSLIKDATDYNSRKHKRTIEGNGIEMHSGNTLDFAIQSVPKENDRDINSKYYDFLNLSSQSIDEKAKTTSHNQYSIANKISLKSKKETVQILKEDLQLGIGIIEQEVARNKPRTKILRKSIENDMKLGTGSSSSEIQCNKTEKKTPLVSEKDLQLSLGLQCTQKLSCNKPGSETRSRTKLDPQLKAESNNRKIRHNKLETETPLVPEKDLQLSLRLQNTQKLICDKPGSKTHNGTKQDLQLKAESKDRKIWHNKIGTETPTVLGKDLITKHVLGSRKMDRDNYFGRGVNTTPICHDFLSLKLGLQDNTQRNVTSLDSIRGKNNKHEKEDNSLQYDNKKQRHLSPASLRKNRENSKHLHPSIVKPIPIVKIGKDDEGMRFNLKGNMIGNQKLRSESKRETAFRNPMELLEIEKDIGRLWIESAGDKNK